MGVLVVAGATAVAIAAGIAFVIGETEGEAVVGSEPHIVRPALPDEQGACQRARGGR